MPSEEPTVALSSSWQRFQEQGGEAHPATESLSATGVQKTLPPDSADASLGPAEIQLSSLEHLRLAGADADFRPKGTLGKGGMGEVRLAVDRGLRREVALKTASGDSQTRSRALLQEALFTGYLEHPNVIPVHRLGLDESDQPVLVMKRVMGTSWSELLADPEHPAWSSLPGDRLRASLRVLIQVCNAAQYAHSQGILHRDIKPSNVMIGAFGEVYLVDWGLAMRLDQRSQPGPSAIVGTLAYMAPEMLDEELSGLSERTDVYLLGATLHHVLAGAPRHTGDAHYNVMLKVYRSEPFDYAPGVPHELAALCNRACAADPALRPESALAFRTALESFLEHQGSVELADKAQEKLGLLASEYARGDEADERTAASLLAACRFGYEQALEVWPGNAAAQDGLQRCLELAIDYELSRRNRGLAASLLATLPRARPDLEERLRALDAELAAGAGAQEELAALQHDLSLEVSARERVRSMWSLAVVGYLSLLVFACLYLLGYVAFDYTSTTIFGGALGTVMFSNLWWHRRALLVNQASRRLVMMVFAAWLSVMVHLAMCWVYQPPMWIVHSYVGVLMLAFLLQMAAAVDKRLWYIVPLPVAGLFSGPLGFDPLVLHAFVGILIFGYIAWIWSRKPPS